MGLFFSEHAEVVGAENQMPADFEFVVGLRSAVAVGIKEFIELSHVQLLIYWDALG